MSKNRQYINFGPFVITFQAQHTQNFAGVVVTCYVDHCSVRSHHLHNEMVRTSFIDAVRALVGGGDDTELFDKLDKTILDLIS